MANRRETVQRDPFGRVSSEYEEENEEEANYDTNGLLKDGHRVRVPLYLRDGVINPNLLPHQQAKAANQTQQQGQDAAARKFGLTDGLQLHKPGFRYNTDAAAIERSRQAYADADANAWKNSRASGKDSVNTSVSTGDLRNPLNNQRKDADTDAKAEAYRLYDEEQANAWRGGK